MKKSIVLSAAVAVVLGAGLASTAFAQTKPEAPAAPSVHKVGLIDMAHIFKNYKKFTALRDDLKTEIEQSDAKGKQMLTQINAINGELKELKQGSAGYAAKEKQLLSLNTDMEAFRRSAQREFLTKESQIYKTIYLEVSDAVEKYAYHYKYTLIMRFNREELEGANEPQDILARMNRQVVYFRPEDDITVSVLDYLNRKYESSAAPAPAASGTKPAPRTAAGNK